MKYGVVVYKDSQNIGDDIQSYAAAQLLPQVDYYIEREHLDVFRPEEPEPVNAIINGWLMYNKLAWPISPCINPLYISMHFWKNDALDIGNTFLDGIGGEDLRRFQPIGCRDKETQDLLDEVGIENWFSGCVTLTLKAKLKKEKQKYICLTDVSEAVENYIRGKYPDLVIKVIHHEGADVISPDMDWNQRFNNVEKLLEVYQNAAAVVTTRLHCALPCLALETPVLLLSEVDIAEQGRFDGLNTLAYHGSESDYLNENLRFDLNNPPQNPSLYRDIRKNLIEKVQKFVEENKVCTQELKERFNSYDKNWEQRALWKDEELLKIMYRAIEKWKENHSSFEELQKGKDWLENQYNIFQKELENVKEEKENLIKENEELKKTNFDLDNKNIELNIYKQLLEHKNQDLIEENRKCNEQNDVYYNLIEELKNSFSWKLGWILTAFPRMIADRIRKGK